VNDAGNVITQKPTQRVDDDGACDLAMLRRIYTFSSFLFRQLFLMLFTRVVAFSPVQNIVGPPSAAGVKRRIARAIGDGGSEAASTQLGRSYDDFIARDVLPMRALLKETIKVSRLLNLRPADCVRTSGHATCDHNPRARPMERLQGGHLSVGWYKPELRLVTGLRCHFADHTHSR
jgi:hypothetical protein